MKLNFSKHAKYKMEERKLKIEEIEKVLKGPNFIFYDIETKTFVFVREIEEIKTNLVVVHKKENDTIKIITTYPCKHIEKEIERKEKIRWLRIKK